MDTKLISLLFSPLLVSPLVCAIVYYFARKRLKVVESSKSRAHLFYRIVSTMLLGQFLGHWQETFTLMVPVGWFVAYTTETIYRICGSSPPDYDVVDDLVLDKVTMVNKSYINVTDVTSPEVPDIIFAARDNVRDERKRYVILVIAFVLFLSISIADGMTISPNVMAAEVVVCYYFHNIILTLSICAIMLHAKLHVLEQRRLFWWCALSALWSIIYLQSALIVVFGWSATMYHPAMNWVYGFTSGVLLRMHSYFDGMKSVAQDGRETVTSILLVFFVLGTSMVTAYYL